MTTEDKAWIDKATLVELLRRWRFAEVGDSMFQGDTGDYYAKRLFGLRDADNDAWVRASKEVGF